MFLSSSVLSAQGDIDEEVTESEKNGFLIFKFLVQFSSSPFTSTNVKTLNFPKINFKSFLSEFQTTARRQERMGQIPDCASEGRVRITGA